MRPLSLKKRNIIFTLFVGAFIVLIPVILLYALGFRIGANGFSLVRTGGIYIHPWSVRGTVSVNDRPVGETALIGRDYLVQSLKPARYAIALTRDGYFDWRKTVPVRSQMVSEVNPFIITKTPELSEIGKFTQVDPTKPKTSLVINPAFKVAQALFTPPAAVTTAAESDPDVLLAESQGKMQYQKFRKMALWKKDEKISVAWLGEHEYIPPYFCDDVACRETVTVLGKDAHVGDFTFYPDRNDILIVSLPDGIYAIEADTRDTQNKMPLYMGENLSFRLSGYTLYIQKNPATFVKINLE